MRNSSQVADAAQQITLDLQETEIHLKVAYY